MSRLVTKTKRWRRDSLDHALQFDAGFMRRLARHEVVETRLEPRGVGFQRGVGQALASSADATGAPKQMAQVGREDIVAGVDGVLHVADEMGEADLMFLVGQAHLPAIAVGHPEIRPEIAEEILDHRLGPRGLGEEDGAVVVMEHPQPPVFLADPQARSRRTAGRFRTAAGADRAASARQRRRARRRAC